MLRMQQHMRLMGHRLSKEIAVDLPDIRVLVGVAQLVRSVEPIQHPGPRLGQFAVEPDGLATAAHAAAVA